MRARITSGPESASGHSKEWHAPAALRTPFRLSYPRLLHPALCTFDSPSSRPRLYLHARLLAIAMSDASASAPSVRLPHRRGSDTLTSNKPPVWSINQSACLQPAPLPAKCDRHEPGRSGVCCKELKGDDERTLVNPDVVRDV